MIDATQVTRAVQDTIRWCQRRPWRVLLGVLFVLIARSWMAGAIDPPSSSVVAITNHHVATQSAAWLESKPLPKDYLQSKAASERQDVYRECHRHIREQMTKFSEWELLKVRNAFTTTTPRGRVTVVGIVLKTKHASGNENWIIWDQTWFFRDGKMIADFDTVEFGEQGAMVWCFLQEEIQKVYGYAPPDSRTDHEVRLGPN